ncbi:hypothetical protein HZA76_00515 [Candidatus Roizmanbacteria bacterium]|nr:hypothetical protein [Candidatus Roizmanbacteria bacterium]
MPENLLLANYIPSLMNRVVKDSTAAFRKLYFPNGPKTIDQDFLRYLTEDLFPILSRERGYDEKGVTNLVLYAGPRLPQEVFSSKHDVILKFEDDPSFFVDEKGLKPGVKTAPSRSRWYKAETVQDEEHPELKKTQITIHAQSQTAVLETLVHLSVVERVRDEVKKLIMQNRLTDQSMTFLWNILGLLIKDKSDRVPKTNVWAARKIEVAPLEKPINWEDLVSIGERSSKTALAFAEQAHSFLEENKNFPTMLLFSNDYSLPNILSHHLLNKKSGEISVREHIINRALLAWNNYKDEIKVIRGRKKNKIRVKTTLEALGESLSCLKMYKKESDVKEISPEFQFIIDNMIIFDLTRKDNGDFGDKVIDTFVRDFRDPRKMEDLGIETAVEKNKSPTADPLYYIDFSKTKDEVIDGLNPILKNAIRKLKEKRLAAFFLAYAPGDLTYSIIKEMTKKIRSITSIGEVGKVAQLVFGTDQREINEIGQLVLPKKTFSSTGPVKVEIYQNRVEDRHIHPFEKRRRVRKTTLMQVPTVILQDRFEMIDLVRKLFHENLSRQNITLNMEVESFKNARSLGLDIFEADYLSDHAIPSHLIKEFAGTGKEKLFQQITRSLDRKGRHGVHAATAAVILAFADSIKN